MWSRILFGSALSAQLLVVLASGGAIFADEPAAEVSKPLFLREKTIRIEVIHGRVQVRSVRGAQNRTMQKGSPDAEVRESLSLMAAPDELMVRFESVLPERRILLTQAEGIFTLEREGFAVGKTSHFQFQQRADGRCEVLADGMEKPLVCHGGLWHLSLLHPQLFQEQVVPALEELSPDWKLLAQAQAMRSHLIHLGEQDDRTQIEAWSQWTTDLSSEQFAVRQAADRALREAGPPVLGFLEQMEKTELQPEQKARLKRIYKQVSPPVADTPELAAIWLEHDPHVWVTLLGSSNDIEQLVARKRLETISGDVVRYDATASAEVKQMQLRKLERRFGEK